MLKKVASFLSKLNIFCVIIFLICFVIVRLDIMPDDFFTVCLWNGFVSLGVILLFIISALILTFKEKKPQTDFGFVIAYLLDTVFIGLVGCLIYVILRYGIFWN